MYKYLLFDLDGTLTDPAMGITNSIIYAITELGQKAPPREELYKYIGPPLSKTFGEFFPEDKIQTAIDTYRIYFRSKGMFENVVYDGIPELLDKLNSKNIPLAVATSKPEEFAVTILKHFGLADKFTVIGGASMDGIRGEKHQVIEYTLNRLSASAEECIMIGDRMYDINGAKALKMASIGVTWGYGSRAELTEAGADAVADTTDELMTRITELMRL